MRSSLQQQNVWQSLYNYFATFKKIPEVRMPSKLQIGIFLIVLLFALGISLKNYHSIQIGITGDDATYVVLARSIAWHDSYGLINGPGAPQPTRFPFGFPLLLSPIAEFFPEAPEMMKFVSLIATLCNMSLLFWGWSLLSRKQSYWWSLFIISMYGFSQATIEQSRQVMSEPVFTSFVFFSLILAQYCFTHRKRRMLVGCLLMLGNLMFFTFSIRIIGITLCFSIVLGIGLLSLKSAIKLLFMLLLGTLLFMSIIVFFTPIPLSSLLPYEYFSQFNNPHSYGQEHIEAPLYIRLFSSFWEYMTHHLRISVVTIGGGAGELNFGKRFGIANLPAISSFTIAVVILVGFISSLLRSKLSLSVYLFILSYFGAILLWPWREARFLYPIQPFLCYSFLQGIYWISQKIVVKTRSVKPALSLYGSRGAVIVVSAAILIVAFYRGIIDTGNSFAYMPRDFRAETQWLKANSPSDALIMAMNPISIHLYSQRHTINYSYTLTMETLQQTLAQHSVDYILVAPKKEWRTDGVLTYDDYTQETLLPLVKELESNRYLALVHQDQERLVQVYQVNKSIGEFTMK